MKLQNLSYTALAVLDKAVSLGQRWQIIAFFAGMLERFFFRERGERPLGDFVSAPAPSAVLCETGSDSLSKLFARCTGSSLSVSL